MVSNKSSNYNQFISLPTGGGALHGIGEKFSPDLHTGTGNFTVPITLPPGRNGFQPQLNLVYSTGNGNSPFGLGWQLSIPNVTRRISKGVPQYHDNSVYMNDWDTFILSGAEDLVPVGLWKYDDTIITASGSKKLKKIDHLLTSEDFAQAPVIEFRPRTEGLFARIYHHHYDNDDYWEVRSKDGLVSFYGSPGKSRYDNAVIADPANKSRVFAWNLIRTTDTFGNRIDYIYEHDAVQTDGPHDWDQIYLSEIRYIDYGNNRNNPQFLVKIKFFYEERPDKFSTYCAGFEIRTVRRCTKIEVSTHHNVNSIDGTDNTIICRTYHLCYFDLLEACSLEQSPPNGVSLLYQIRVEGHDGGRSEWLPPLEFGYTTFEPSRRKFSPITGSEMPPLSLANHNYEMVDVTGNGIPDILEMNGTVRYWRNLGDGRLDKPKDMQDAPAGFKLSDPGVQLIDANGDGRIDLLTTLSNGLSGYYSLTVNSEWDRRSFQRYEFAPSFDLKDPEVRLVDLNGDGIIDAVRSGSNFEYFFNDHDIGWKAYRHAERRKLDEFPNVNFSDSRVKIADMTGEGLQDIVLVYDGSVQYWPSLGDGNWGKCITMNNSPHLPYGYDPQRVLIGDVDGDGLADIVYVDDKKVLLWINQSGNGWSKPITIEGTPRVSDIDAIRLTDMLGIGISGILWSTDVNGLMHNNMFFLDFTGSTKPYLLDKMDNHMGAITRVKYISSTKFYLKDEERHSTSWKTPLPFPVQVVEQVEVIDQISKGKLTTEYEYHHGYWDGAEREFRGFGRVDQRDSETFQDYNSEGLYPSIEYNKISAKFFSPPTETRIWFHQGPIGDEYGGWHESDFSNEFWSEDPQIFTRPSYVTNYLTSLQGQGRRAKHDALRTLRGRILRTELYSAARPKRQDRPETIKEYLHIVLPLPVGSINNNNRLLYNAEEWQYKVFFPCTTAERTTQWERGDDPLWQLKFMDKYDRYGQVQSRINIAVPRGRDFTKEASAGDPYLVTHTETKYALRDDTQCYIVDRVAGTTTSEVKNDGSMPLLSLKQSIEDGRISSDLLVVISQVLNFYDGPAFQGRPFGEIGDHGALVRTESLVLTDEIIDKAFNIDGVHKKPPYIVPGRPSWTPDYPTEFRSLLPLGDPPIDPTRPSLKITKIGYGYSEDGTKYKRGYFAATDRRSYDFHESSNGKGLLSITLDSLGHRTNILYDRFRLLPVKVTDAANLIMEAEYDYRTLQPIAITDQNKNQSRYTFTPLGLLHEIFVCGKQGENEGDKNRPGTSFVYNLIMHNGAKGKQPISTHTIRYVNHDTNTDVSPQDLDKAIKTVEYSDGFGRLIQTRSQAENIIFGNETFGDIGLPADQSQPVGDVIGSSRSPDDLTNVVVSGWQIYDNKARVVEKYEPFFAIGWEYSPPSSIQVGQKITMYYDALGRIIHTINPDKSEQICVYGVPIQIDNPWKFRPTPWEIYVYDANDNAGRTHPTESARYQDHHNTPISKEINALGYTIKTIERNGHNSITEWYTTRSTYDIRGNVIKTTDALGRPAFQCIYDLANKAIRTEGLDVGDNCTIRDASGNTTEYRDAKGAITLRSFDALNRVIRMWARDSKDENITLRELLIYGDNEIDSGVSHDQAAILNLLGRIYKHLDESGLVSFVPNPKVLNSKPYDFNGNILEKVRQVINDTSIMSVFNRRRSDWKVDVFRVNWQPPIGISLDSYANNLLDPFQYRTSITYDALNHIKVVAYPEDIEGLRKELHLKYNYAGALENVKLDGKTYLEYMGYNAKGQRTLLIYSNRVMVRYAYDLKTSMLVRMRTERYSHLVGHTYRPAGEIFQDFSYRYDFAGNILAIRDRTPKCSFPHTRIEELDRLFTYDALYRLLSATGRECKYDMLQLPQPWSDNVFCTDPVSTRGYSQEYHYDEVGNLESFKHQTRDGVVVRNLGLLENSTQKLNRLHTLTVRDQTYIYQYDDTGNIKQEGSSRHFEWDHSNHLRTYYTKIHNEEPSVYVHYLYDSSGQRVKKLARKQGGQFDVTVYIDGIFEYCSKTNARGTKIIDNNILHILDNKKRIAIIRIGNPVTDDLAQDVTYILTDHLNSSNVILDGNGNLMNREEYFPYGETSFGGYVKKRYRFTGKEREEESKLYYHGTRYYLPWLSRWLSCDPLLIANGASPYRYTSNNPLLFNDPTGMEEEKTALEVTGDQSFAEESRVARYASVEAARYAVPPKSNVALIPWSGWPVANKAAAELAFFSGNYTLEMTPAGKSLAQMGSQAPRGMQVWASIKEFFWAGFRKQPIEPYVIYTEKRIQVPTGTNPYKDPSYTFGSTHQKWERPAHTLGSSLRGISAQLVGAAPYVSPVAQVIGWVSEIKATGFYTVGSDTRVLAGKPDIVFVPDPEFQHKPVGPLGLSDVTGQYVTRETVKTLPDYTETYTFDRGVIDRKFIIKGQIRPPYY